MKQQSRKAIQENLASQYECYVLITCDRVQADGKMKVEMSYEGDTALAAYLLQGAQSFLEEEEEDSDEVQIHSI